MGSGASAAVSRRGMVATSHPAAVEIGVDTLRSGGSAVDAAIAANVALGFAEPMSCGLGGDVFALVWDAEHGQLVGLNGSGRAPAALSIDRLRREGLARVPRRGPLSVTVPGCVDGWWSLHRRFGRLPWDDLLRPTIELARRGVAVPPVIGAMWSDEEELLACDPGSRDAFLPAGRAPRPGEVVTNPGLSETLDVLGREGRDAFYTGSVSESLLACARETGIPLSVDDLASHTSTWTEPVCLRFRGVDVWELPPNTQGVVALDMLNILSGYDLERLGHNRPDTLHLFVEAKKRAYERRAALYGDPDHVRLPAERLLDPAHGDRERRQIDPDRAAPSIDIGADGLGCDTVYVTAVDERRNAASLIQSLYRSFGSGITPPGTGFALQNRGSLFSLDPRHPNALGPRRRPFHTIIPAFVTKGERPLFSFGVMGGDMQPQGHVQILLNLLVFGLDPQAAGDAPRVRHEGSSTPMGDTMRDGGTVHVEPGVGEETAAALRQRGHRVVVSEGGYGGYQGIWIDDVEGRLIGGSESRKDGCAKGY